jgi:hypothetical protein
MDGWNDFEKRMYFYAYKRVTLSKDEIAEWRSLLPDAMEMQYVLIDAGSLPMTLTLERCRELSSKFREQRLKTESCVTSVTGDGCGL